MEPMKRAVVGGALVGAAGMLAFVACDLFHSTDFATLCDTTPTADACTDGPRPAEAGPAPPTNFCAWDPATAYGNAQHACAWLSACELPLGNNAFGPCMVSALLAYDCATNPDRPVTGRLHGYWDALWQAASCADVDRAVFPGAGNADLVPPCRNGGGFTSCGVAYDGGDNSSVRVECDEAGAPARGESCLAQGRTCAGGACVASVAGPCVTGCNGTTLDDCDDAGVDRGTSCAVFGAGSCVVTDAGPACASTSSSSCTPTPVVSCSDGGVAEGCPSGTSETVDCNVLTGMGSCNAGPAVPAWDVSSACFADAAACAPDSCKGNGDMLVSCARGAPFSVSCSTFKLGSCVTVMTFDGPRAACGRPP
jgi:hypothetical protein